MYCSFQEILPALIGMLEKTGMDPRASAAASNLAKKFAFLQERAQRKPAGQDTLDLTSTDAASQKANISQLKEFYLQRLSKNDPKLAAHLSEKLQKHNVGELAQPQASGQGGNARPKMTPMAKRPAMGQMEAAAVSDDIEIMCNVCFTLIKSSEVDEHTRFCYMDRGCGAGAAKTLSPMETLDLKLKKLRLALEARLQNASTKVNVMRHLTQLRYHIDTAVKWTPGCAEIGALSDHTVQQMKQLTATSRVFAPAVYIFSKRIENVVVQKERELRKLMMQSPTNIAGSPSGHEGNIEIPFNADRDQTCDSIVEVNSVVSELDSTTGTQYAETVVTQDQNPQGSADVGNVQDANEYLSMKNEDEQRRWFYSQCLTAKLSCADKSRVRKVLISDLYTRAKEDRIPVENWKQWIQEQLIPDEPQQESIQIRTQADIMQATAPISKLNTGTFMQTTAPLPNLNQASAGDSMPGGYLRLR